MLPFYREADMRECLEGFLDRQARFTEVGKSLSLRSFGIYRWFCPTWLSRSRYPLRWISRIEVRTTFFRTTRHANRVSFRC